MVIPDDLYSHHVLTRDNQVRHIELAPHKGAFDTPQFLSIHIDIRFPVDPVEVQEQAILLESFRHFKFVAIPEVRPEERFGYLQLVVRIVRIGDCPDILVTAQYRSRYSCHDPVLRFELRSRDFFTRSIHFRSTLQLPITAGQDDLSFRNGRGSHRLSHQSTFTHNFHFAQDVTAVVRRLLHQKAYIAGILFAVQSNFIYQAVTTRQFGRIFPLHGIIRHLHFSFDGFVDPVQHDLVELRRAAKVHIQPFFTHSSTHPGTVEELRRLHFH